MAGYNLSCIVTLPIYQRKGYGFFLISFSYLLSQRENRLGSPEKPLSDLGLLSYRSYWKTALANALLGILDAGLNISIQELGKRTGMTDDDVVSGLEGLDALVRDPQTGFYAIKVNREQLAERVELVDRKGYVKVKDELLKWTPYLLGRREAKEILEAGLESLVHRGPVPETRENQELTTEAQEVNGIDIPPDRFVSVAVRNLIPPSRLIYDATESQTPIPSDIPITPKPNSTSADGDDLLDDEPVLSSPSSPSAVEDDVSDEPYSAEDFEDEEVSEEEMSDFLSDDSNEFNPRKRRRLNRSSSQTSSKRTSDIVRVKQVAKAPRNRAAFQASSGADVRKAPRVIAAKAPRSRAGRNPPEVMARRGSLRKV
jgi:hypothetical protein